MRGCAEWRAALAGIAAMAGVGLASGREMTLFFAQMKGAAWWGVLAASALYGLLVGGFVWRGQARPCGGGLDRACDALRLLLAALAAAFMLSRLGMLGALTLPLRHSYAFGAAFGLLAALLLSGMKQKWPLGLFIALYASAFYAANALDARPLRVIDVGAAEFDLAGNVGAALLLAAPYACLTACAAGWNLAALKPGTARPAALGIRAAALLGGMLWLANLALLRNGDAALVQPMPWVALSARWGIAGFWLCAGLGTVCALSTLASALGMLMAALRSPGRRALGVYMISGGALLFGVLAYGAA